MSFKSVTPSSSFPFHTKLHSIEQTTADILSPPSPIYILFGYGNQLMYHINSTPHPPLLLGISNLKICHQEPQERLSDTHSLLFPPTSIKTLFCHFPIVGGQVSEEQDKNSLPVLGPSPFLAPLVAKRLTCSGFSGYSCRTARAPRTCKKTETLTVSQVSLPSLFTDI